MRALLVARFEPALMSRLARLVDPTYVTWSAGEQWSSAELCRRLEGFSVLTTEERDPVNFIGGDVCANANDLRLIICARRTPPVDVAAATKEGILVCNMPGINAGAVADLAVAFILLCARPIVQAMEQTRKGLWSGHNMHWVYGNFTGFEMERRIVGLIGVGAIGAEVARRLRGFGMRILGYDPYISHRRAATVGVNLVSLDELLKASDFVSIHAPSNAATRNLLGARELGLMKPTAYLVNTARAALVDEQALYQALEKRQITGAALDVFHQEPVSADSPLLRHPSVIVTPHIGGATQDQVYSQSRVILDTLRFLLRGKPPSNLFNPEVLKSPQLRYPLTVDFR